MADEDEDPADVLRSFRESTRGGVTRGEPMTLEEMTRRRDGWRVQWEKTDRELMAARARERLLARRVEVAERGTEWDAAEIRRLNGQLAASQAEARRYAEECGRLRDRLAQGGQ